MTLRVFIGYDIRQPVAFHVAVQSLINHATEALCITPLDIHTLPITRTGLTPFTYSRFLVPWLCNYKGRALYCDSDFLCRSDIAPLFENKSDEDIRFVHHERAFERSSLMVFDCWRFEYMTPEYVEHASNLNTCAFAKVPGKLDKEWNHLVGYDAPNPNAKMVHFTQGLPCYPQTQDDEFGEEWRSIAQQSVSTIAWEALMGNSVHAAHVHKRAKERLQ
jgi:hypothetical protein